MLAIKGIYDNGTIFLKERIRTKKPVDVIVAFLEDVEIPVPKKVDMERFSFGKVRELLKDYRGSLSDAVIEERRSAV